MVFKSNTTYDFTNGQSEADACVDIPRGDR
jgi:hypothetical protein